MEFRNKGRDDISRLVSDRQSYISSLELRLEKFTQSTQSFLDIKEKVEKLSYSVTSAEERIQGLNWIIKQQNENHQQQIKQIFTRYEELQQQVSNVVFNQGLVPAGKGLKSTSTENLNTFQDNMKIVKDLEELIAISNQQIKNELEQRFEILSTKSNILSKGLEAKIDDNTYFKTQTKQDFSKELERMIEKNYETIKDLESKIDANANMNLDRYKELSVKLNASSLSNLTDEITFIKQKLIRIDEFKKQFEENEVRRELEVKEASQSAWNVENQIKHIEQNINASRHGKEPRFESLLEPLETKQNYLTMTVKKYLSVQKSLHKKVEIISEILEGLRNKKKPTLENTKTSKRSISNKSKNSNRSRNTKTLEASYSPSLYSSRVSILKPASKILSSRPASAKKSRIDILYEELSNMFT